MHDTLTIGIPVFVILFGILLNQRAVDKLEARMEARFNAVDVRFNAVDARFNAVEARFNGVEGRFEGVNARLDRMQADLAHFYQTLGEHEAKIDALMSRNKEKP